ncbi:hypothetical protein D3C72_2290720 [compost metagenome]
MRCRAALLAMIAVRASSAGIFNSIKLLYLHFHTFLLIFHLDRMPIDIVDKSPDAQGGRPAAI